MDSNTQVEKMTAEVKEKSNEISGLQESIVALSAFSHNLSVQGDTSGR